MFPPDSPLGATHHHVACNPSELTHKFNTRAFEIPSRWLAVDTNLGFQLSTLDTSYPE